MNKEEINPLTSSRSFRSASRSLCILAARSSASSRCSIKPWSFLFTDSMTSVSLCLSTEEQPAPVCSPKWAILVQSSTNFSQWSRKRQTCLGGGRERVGGGRGAMQFSGNLWWAPPIVWRSRVPDDITGFRRGRNWPFSSTKEKKCVCYSVCACVFLNPLAKYSLLGLSLRKYRPS